MRSVFVNKVSETNGVPEIIFNVAMKSTHDKQGQFGVGFRLVDKTHPHIIITDDEDTAIGIITGTRNMRRFLDGVIKNRGYKSIINYIFPVTPEPEGMTVAVPRTEEMFSSANESRMKDYREMLQALDDIENEQ